MADNITLEDKDGVPKITRTKEDSSAVHTPVMLLADQEVKSGNGYVLGSSTSRSITVTTTEGSFEVTSAALFTAADIGSAIEGTGIPANAIITTFADTSTVTFSTPPTTAFPHGPPATASGSPSATIRSGFAGSFEESRSKGVVRQLHVIALVLSNGVAFPADLGGTFVFQYSENGSTPTISETRAVTDFASVRDFDLVNAGAYFRVMFAPDRDIVSGDELIIGTTTFRHHFDGQFVRLANQEIEEANAAMGQAFAYLKLFDAATGKSVNIRPSNLANNVVGTEDAILVRSVGAGAQPNGDFVNTRSDGLAEDVDGVNVQTTTPLSASASYQSGWIDTDGWASAAIVVSADQVSGTNGVLIEFTDDANAGSPTVRATRTYTFTDADVAKGSQVFRFPTEMDGMRITYTNGGTNQGSFFLACTLRVASINPQGGIEGSFDETNTAVMTRGVVVGKNDAGNYGNIERSDGGGLRTSIKEHETDTPIRACDGWQTTRVSVSTTTAVLLSSGAALANRVTVEIFNTSGNRELRIGPTVARVDAGQYRTVAAGDHIIMELGPGVDIAGRSDSSTLTVEFVELADSSV